MIWRLGLVREGPPAASDLGGSRWVPRCQLRCPQKRLGPGWGQAALQGQWSTNTFSSSSLGQGCSFRSYAHVCDCSWKPGSPGQPSMYRFFSDCFGSFFELKFTQHKILILK